MADNKPFSFEDFMKMRQEEIPSLLSKYRKKFDLTANTWMEDPAIYERAKQAASTDPNFAKALAMKGNDPAFTETFIKKLDELVPQTSFEQAEKVAKSEIGSELSDLLSKRVENLRRTNIPQAGTPDAEELVKLSSRYVSPRVLSETPSEVQKILGIGSYTPKDLEGVVGKSISEAQLDPSSRYSSGRVIPGGSSQLDEALGVKPYTPKDIEFKGFDVVEGPQSPVSTIDKEGVKRDFLKQLAQDQFRKGIESNRFEMVEGPSTEPYPESSLKDRIKSNRPPNFSMVEGPQASSSIVDNEAVKRDFINKLTRDRIESNRFQMMDEGPVSSPDAKEVRLRAALESNPAAMVEGPAPAPYPESSIKDAFKEGVRLKRAADFRAGLTNDFEALRPIVGDLTERLGRPPTGKEIMSALGEFGSKGASKLGELGLKGADKLTDVAGKVLTSKPVEFAGRKVIAPVATLVEGARTVGDIKRGKYGDALASGLGAASAIATMAGSPAALPLAAGSLSVTGAQEMGKQQAELADEGIFIDPLSGMARSEEELPESVRKAPMPVLKKAEPELELSQERTKEDEDIDADIDQLMKDQESSVEEPETLEQEVLPEATPEEPGLELPEEPLSAVERKPSGLGDKLMDIVGLPSAYAADKPKKGEVPMFRQKTKKAKVPKHKLENLVYSEAIKDKVVPPALLLAIVDQESSYNLNNPLVAVQPTGARGMTQVTGDTFREIQKHFPEFRKMKHKDLSDLSNATSLRKQIRAGIAALKVKAREARIKWNEKNLNDPQVQDILLQRYRGHQDKQVNIDYAKDVLKKSQPYQNVLNQYNEKRKKNAAPKKESQSLLDRVLGGMSAVAREGRPLPEPKSTGMASLPFGPDVEGEDVQLASMDNPVSDEQSKIDEEINLLDQQIKSLEEPVEPKEEESSTIRLMQRLQEEGNEEKANKLMAMQNLLRAQSMTPIMKGMALAASGIVGAGPKKPFVTVPKLEGMETFDQLERAPASQLAMQKMLSEDKYEDPNSAVSEAYRKYAGEVLKKVDSNFDESRLAGLSANSIKTLLPMGIKEDSLLLRKLGMEGRKEKEQLATTLKQQKENRMLKKDAVAKFDRDTKDEKVRIFGAKQAKTLINQIKAADPKDRLIASKNLKNQLTLETLRLATPAGMNVLAGDRAAANINTLYGDISNKIGYLASMPTDTITDEYLDQLTKEIDLLQNKYKEFFIKKTDSILKAYDNPVQQEAIKQLAAGFVPEVYGQKLEGAEKPPVAEMAPAQDEMVKVQAPNGKMGKIPKSKLAQALKEGFKEVK